MKLEKNNCAGVVVNEGRQTVDVIVCVNARVKEFESKLSKKIKKQIEFESKNRPLKSKSLVFAGFDLLTSKASTPQKNFPYVGTAESDLDANLVNLMAQQACYSLKTGLEKLKEAGEFNVDKLKN